MNGLRFLRYTASYGGAFILRTRPLSSSVVKWALNKMTPFATLKSMLQVFQTHQFRHSAQVLIRCPAPKTHFNQGHSERFKMAPNQTIAVFIRHLRKAQFKIATYDCAALAGDAVTSPTDDSSDSQRQPVRKPTDKS